MLCQVIHCIVPNLPQTKGKAYPLAIVRKYFFHSFLNADKSVSTMVDPCHFTVPAIAGSVSGVIVVAAGVVVIVIIVFLQYLKFKKRACQRDKALHLEEIKEENDFYKSQKSQEQEEKKAARHEYHQQWSREKVDKLLEDLKEMKETVQATNDIELFRGFLTDYMQMTREIYGKYLSSVATDSEEERNEEIEREQKEQLLNLLRDILKGGRRNKSLKAEMLSTIMDEVGSDVNDFVDQKCQCTCL